MTRPPAPPPRRRVTRLSARAARLCALALVAGLALGPLAGTAPAQAAAPPAAAQVLAAGTAVRLPGPPAATAVPADGRLRGDGFAAIVEGVATGPATTTERAAPGQTLWVVGLAIKTSPPASGGVPTAVTATVTTGAGRAQLPLPAGTTSAVWYAASLPAGATDTVLTLSGSSSTAAFSLTHMAREGATPAVAYRSTDSLAVTVPAPAQLPETWTEDDDEETNPVTLPIIVDSATLSYWAPDVPGHTAPTPTQAFLTVTLQSNDPKDTDDGFGPLSIVTAVPATALTLTVPGQPPIPAQLKTGGGGDNENTIVEGDQPSAGQSYGAFPDTYYFPVSADLTTATLTVNPPALQAFVNSGAEGAITPNPAGTTAQLALTPVTPVAWQPPAGATATPARLTSRGTDARGLVPAGSGGSTHHQTVIILLVIAALLIVAAGVIALARRRTQRPLPAVAPAGVGPPPAAPAPPHPWPATAHQAPTSTPTPAPTPTSARPTTTPEPGPPSAWPAPAPRSTPQPTPTPADPEPADERPAPVPTVAPAGAPSEVADPEALPDDKCDDSAPVPAPEPPAPARPARPKRTGPWVPPTPAVLPGPAIRVLGLLRFVGWANPPNTPSAIELALYLALHTSPVSTELLATDLASHEDVPLGAQSVRKYVSALRLNHLDPGVTLTNQPGRGYLLTGVATDLGLLTAATTDARHDPTPDQLDRLAAALALVDGIPLADVDGRWVPGIGAVAAVQDAALVLAGHVTDTDPHLALWAGHQAQETAKITDQTVIAAELTAAAATTTPGVLAREWARGCQLLADIDQEPDTHLVALYERLRQHPHDPERPC